MLGWRLIRERAWQNLHNDVRRLERVVTEQQGHIAWLKTELGRLDHLLRHSERPPEPPNRP